MSAADQYRRLDELMTRVATLERKVEFMLKALNLEYTEPESPEASEILTLLKANRKIDAIKLYRERHNVGMDEAKAAVEKIERGSGD